jgi:hypothetical protein
MIKKSWLLLMPLVMSMLWVGTAPSQAAGENWRIVSRDAPRCDAGELLNMRATGFDGDPTYLYHVRVSSGGKTYSNEQDYPDNYGNGDHTWQIGPIFNYYGSTDTPTAWPMTPGQPVTIVASVERPQGTLISSWTMVAASCDSATLLYNDETSKDVDQDFVATPTDKCPSLQAFTANGCPVRDRTLTLKAKYGPKRVVGKLYAVGYPALYVNRQVTVWKKRPGPDKKMAIRTTNLRGKFRVRVGKGRYYATSPGYIAPASGEALADISNRVRVR